MRPYKKTKAKNERRKERRKDIRLLVGCPSCKKNFKFRAVKKRDLKKHSGSTVDCPRCFALLIIQKNKLLKFHEWMNSQDSRWPKDGKNTYWVSI